MNFLFTLFKHLSSIYQQYGKTSCLKVCASDCVKNKTLKNCIFWGKVSQRNFMENNESRGKRALFWMRFTFALTFLSWLLLFLIAKNGSLPVRFTQENPDVDVGAVIDFFNFIVVMFFAGFGVPLSWCLYQLFWLMWIFRATKNLRKVTSTSFSPWLAVICSAIPGLGYLIHYLVFKNLVRQTESALAARRDSQSKKIAEILSKVQSVDGNMVNGFAIMAILAGAIGFIRDTSISGFLAVAFSVASLLCYMKSFAAFIKEEQALFDIYQEEKLMAKVDQVLWQRKLESESADEKTKV